MILEKQQKKSDGEHPNHKKCVKACYSDIDYEQRWQGDIYSKAYFDQESLPGQTIPYWMLVNRTCQLFEDSQQGNGRSIKIPFMNFIAVYPLKEYLELTGNKKNTKNQIKEIIKKSDDTIFLPANPGLDVNSPLIGIFNLIYTFKSDSTPEPKDKILQLSSPFCEHVFQKFSRYFFKVGFDDEYIRSNEYIDSIVSEM